MNKDSNLKNNNSIISASNDSKEKYLIYKIKYSDQLGGKPYCEVNQRTSLTTRGRICVNLTKDEIKQKLDMQLKKETVENDLSKLILSLDSLKLKNIGEYERIQILEKLIDEKDSYKKAINNLISSLDSLDKIEQQKIIQIIKKLSKEKDSYKEAIYNFIGLISRLNKDVLEDELVKKEEAEKKLIEKAAQDKATKEAVSQAENNAANEKNRLEAEFQEKKNDNAILQKQLRESSESLKEIFKSLSEDAKNSFLKDKLSEYGIPNSYLLKFALEDLTASRSLDIKSYYKSNVLITIFQSLDIDEKKSVIKEEFLQAVKYNKYDIVDKLINVESILLEKDSLRDIYWKDILIELFQSDDINKNFLLRFLGSCLDSDKEDPENGRFNNFFIEFINTDGVRDGYKDSRLAIAIHSALKSAIKNKKYDVLKFLVDNHNCADYKRKFAIKLKKKNNWSEACDKKELKSTQPKDPKNKKIENDCTNTKILIDILS